MSDYPTTPEDYVVASYRYLRLAMVILVVTLGISIAIEVSRASCWQGSISAYYYTPVHAVFVGALVAIGVSLVALKGRNPIEDLFFNLAGVLAPIVAFVPTSQPGHVCSEPGDELTIRTSALVSNNVPALLAAATLPIVLAYAVARRQGKVEMATPPRTNLVGLAVSVVLLVVGFWWYNAKGENFESTPTARRPSRCSSRSGSPCCSMPDGPLGDPGDAPRPRRRPADRDPTPRQRRYRRGYQIVAAVMVLGALAIVATGVLGVDWDHAYSGSKPSRSPRSRLDPADLRGLGVRGHRSCSGVKPHDGSIRTSGWCTAVLHPDPSSTASTTSSRLPRSGHDNVTAARLLLPAEFPPTVAVEFAERLEAGGADQLWVIEDCFFTAGISLAAAGSPAPSGSPSGSAPPAGARNPAFTAMELATPRASLPAGSRRHRSRRPGLDGAGRRTPRLARHRAHRGDHGGAATPRR